MTERVRVTKRVREDWIAVIVILCWHRFFTSNENNKVSRSYCIPMAPAPLMLVITKNKYETPTAQEP